MRSAGRTTIGSVLCALVILCMLVPASEAKEPPPADFAYGMVLDKWGKWRGPKLPDGSPDFRIIDRLIEARPRFVRVAPAPYQQGALMRPEGEVAEQLWRLRNAGIRLGFGVNAGRPMKGSPLSEQGYGLRSAEDVVEHVRRVRDASPGLYDVVLLDFFVLWDRQRAQRIVNGISALGLREVVNASGHARDGGRLPLPKGAWAFQAATQAIGGPDWKRNTRRIARGKRRVLSDQDKRFIRTIRNRRPSSHRILRFTVPEQVVFRLEKLRRRTQRGLLKRLARRQRPEHFKMTYPLFVPGMPEGYRGGAERYDSRHEGTFGLQVSLMVRF